MTDQSLDAVIEPLISLNRHALNFIELQTWHRSVDIDGYVKTGHASRI